MVKSIELNGEEYLFIEGNVPSLKNAKIKTSRGIFSSKTVKNYLRSLGIQSYSSRGKFVLKYARRDNEFQKCAAYFDKYLVEKPHEIGFHFIRGSKHKFDFNNASQILADLMTAHDFIEDDDMDNFLPYPMKIEGKAYSYDKENPGVLIKILNKNG
jgi:hypothetical protein